MVTHSVGDSLDESWALLSDDELTGFLRCDIDGKDVVTIDADGGHAIGDTPDHDPVASVLVIDGRRDSVHVVAAIEKSLAAECRCEVEC